MTLEELIEEARERTGDDAEPYLCSDERFTRFANQAEREACRRARLLVDSSTDGICLIALTAGNGIYPLDSRVLFVRRGTIAGQSRPLMRIHHRDLDRSGTEWMDETGEVLGWVVGLDTKKLRLYRTPDVDAQLRLTVCRLPLEDLSLDEQDGEPEIDPRYHDALVSWMCHRFYSINDAEIRDENKAAEALAEFEREFGPPQPAIEEAWAQEHYGFEEDDGNVYSG